MRAHRFERPVLAPARAALVILTDMLTAKRTRSASSIMMQHQKKPNTAPATIHYNDMPRDGNWRNNAFTNCCTSRMVTTASHQMSCGAYSFDFFTGSKCLREVFREPFSSRILGPAAAIFVFLFSEMRWSAYGTLTARRNCCCCYSCRESYPFLLRRLAILGSSQFRCFFRNDSARREFSTRASGILGVTFRHASFCNISWKVLRCVRVVDFHHGV